MTDSTSTTKAPRLRQYKMKIRIKGNSVRFRLLKPEVEKLHSDGYLEERTGFSGKEFVYAIEVKICDKMSIDFSGSIILLTMPQRLIEDLYGSDKVGFEDESGPVKVILEKDFTCIDRVEEDQSDNYPNPAKTC